ncbi:helix-turn-helix domain-containing protein [Cellulomonas sp. JZ18]|uniref:transcriptional regulator n=1 Tax=Cellulomonas sp. JZ18 TaxID=2654191 RepID=UPI0012D47092|nr:transcriptional regulator [Cellulomonas sp. JZ18]QGQ18323.1 helix-turn-helix domain-containing protein [Cellulomonas sp. JZ18]
MSADAPDVASDEVAPRFDEVIHAPVRLRVCGLLAAADQVEFSVVRDALGVSDATLSKHLRVLADAGFVEVRKAASSSRSDARRLTWLRLTAEGRRAFSAHVAELRAIAQGLVG